MKIIRNLKLKETKIATIALSLILILNIPIAANAGIENLIRNVMPKGTMSNVSKGAIVQDQSSGHLIGGSVIMKSPPIDDISLINAQAPTCRLGGLPCGAQLDLRAGAFSFVKSEQLARFFKDLASNVSGYAALMAIKTVCPQCENIMTYLEQIQRSVNQFNINGCDASMAIAKGMAAMASKGAEMTKQSANVISSRGSDMADIRAKSKDDGSDPTDGLPELKNQIGDNFNLVWKALENKTTSASTSSEFREMLMSISGTIIGKKDPQGRRSFAHKKSLISDKLIEQLISGGAGNDVELYNCDTQNKCLNPVKRNTAINHRDSIKGSIDKLLATMIEKIKVNQGAFTQDEEDLIALSQIPLITKIQRELAKGGAHLTVRMEEFLELLAFDVVTNHLTKLLHLSSEAVSELTNVQLVDTKLFSQFETEIAGVLRSLESNRENAFNRFNTIEQTKQRMMMEEAEFEQNFGILNQQISAMN